MDQRVAKKTATRKPANLLDQLADALAIARELFFRHHDMPTYCGLIVQCPSSLVGRSGLVARRTACARRDRIEEFEQPLAARRRDALHPWNVKSHFGKVLLPGNHRVGDSALHSARLLVPGHPLCGVAPSLTEPRPPAKHASARGVPFGAAMIFLLDSRLDLLYLAIILWPDNE